MNTSTFEIHRDEEIDSANIRLYFLSRDRSVLGLMALLVLGLAAGLAWMVGAPAHRKAKAVPPVQELAAVLAGPLPAAAKVTDLIVKSAPNLPSNLEEQILKSSLAPESKLVTVELVKSLSGGLNEANGKMLMLAHQPLPSPGANEAVAELLARRGSIERASEYFQREIQFHQSESSRAKLVSLLARHGQLTALVPLAADHSFAAQFAPSLRLKLAFHQRRWFDAAKALTVMEKNALHLRPLILALVAGGAWFLIAVQAGQPRHLVSYRTIVPALAVLAGCFAAWPAHFVSAWQEQVLGLRATGEFLADFTFYVGNVAVREELIKLAFMLPFLPLLVIRRAPLETLVITGCVGLGFAIEGNLQTYQLAGPSEAFGRLLTANFFHFATSGLLGSAFCDFIWAPRRRMIRFLATLLGVIVAHGVYDAFMNIAGVRALAAVSILSFFVVSQVLFYKLRRWRDHTTDQLFLAATLVFSLTVLAGATVVIAAIEIGFAEAVSAIAANLIGLLLVVLVYFITIKNDSSETVTIRGRKWVVTDASSHRIVVEGDGVVGKFPRLEPGESFSYNSYHTIGMDSTAEGAFFGVTAGGTRVFTRIPPFEMRVPRC